MYLLNKSEVLNKILTKSKILFFSHSGHTVQEAKNDFQIVKNPNIIVRRFIFIFMRT